MGLSPVSIDSNGERSRCEVPVVIFLSLHFQLKTSFVDVKEKYLSEYCFSGTYILSLLLNGYGFTADSWKNIHFMGKVSWGLVRLWGDWVTEAALGLKEVEVSLISCCTISPLTQADILYQALLCSDPRRAMGILSLFFWFMQQRLIPYKTVRS